jgi:hypothetical protein
MSSGQGNNSLAALAPRWIINTSATSENKGWLSPVKINSALLMLAVNIGAGKTIINKKKILAWEDALELCPYEFQTASGKPLEGVGQFNSTLWLSPVILEDFKL